MAKRRNPSSSGSDRPFIPYKAGIAAARRFAKRIDGPIALCGGIAMAFYGSDRLTKDVDVIVQRLPKGGGHRDLSFGGKSYYVDGIEIDAIARADELSDIYAQALEHARFPKGLGIAIVSPEWLALLKLLTGRSKDLTDLKFLIRSGRITLPAMKRLVNDAALGIGTYIDFKHLFTETKIETEFDRRQGDY